MNVEQYLKRRDEQLKAEAARFRTPCARCLQAPRTCYCEHIQTFDPKIRFTILIHKLEIRRRIATGRMSHLCLENSRLIDGYDYTDDPRVNSILNDAHYHSVILYPGRQAKNLTTLTFEQKRDFVPPGKELMIFVIDGTWSTAGKSLRRSRNLLTLPQISFTSNLPSRFRVRQQPKKNCFSTLEAIHHTIELMGAAQNFNVESRQHDRLIHVFDKMVEQQLEFIRLSHATHRHSRHRRQKEPRIF